MEGKNYKFPVRTIAYSQHIDLRALTIPTEMKRAARAGKAEAQDEVKAGGRAQSRTGAAGGDAACSAVLPREKALHLRPRLLLRVSPSCK